MLPQQRHVVQGGFGRVELGVHGGGVLTGRVSGVLGVDAALRQHRGGLLLEGFGCAASFVLLPVILLKLREFIDEELGLLDRQDGDIIFSLASSFFLTYVCTQNSQYLIYTLLSARIS